MQTLIKPTPINVAANIFIANIGSNPSIMNTPKRASAFSAKKQGALMQKR